MPSSPAPEQRVDTKRSNSRQYLPLSCVPDMQTFAVAHALRQKEATMKTSYIALAFGLVCVSTAFAKDPVMLPEAAKQLTKAEIVSLYDSKLYNWMHPSGDKGTGTTRYVAATESISGTFDIGGQKGEWEGKISWKGDQYCFKTRGKGMKKYGPVTCNLVYLDGTTAYEVNPKTKKINSINTPAP
jgi:hypothetical protein